MHSTREHGSMTQHSGPNRMQAAREARRTMNRCASACARRCMMQAAGVGMRPHACMQRGVRANACAKVCTRKQESCSCVEMRAREPHLDGVLRNAFALATASRGAPLHSRAWQHDKADRIASKTLVLNFGVHNVCRYRKRAKKSPEPGAPWRRHGGWQRSPQENGPQNSSRTKRNPQS